MTSRSVLALAALLGCTAAYAAGPPPLLEAPPDARIYLSWRAPYGQPGATTRLDRSDGDTTRVDTLYLTFDPGRACSTFVGMAMTVWFRSISDDSLGSAWWPDKPQTMPQHVRWQFAADPAGACPFPWEFPGLSHIVYKRPNSSAASVRAVFATSGDGMISVEKGKMYSLGRFLLKRPPAGLQSSQPVCVEWSDASMAYEIRNEPRITQGVRFVGINAPAGEHGCGTATQAEAPKPKPKTKSAKGKTASSS